MKVLKFSQKYHKWLMLFLGIQFLIWSVSGAYMVFFDIDYIHGDSLIETHQTKINPANIQYSLVALSERYPEVEDISIGKFMNKDVYRFKVGSELHLLDAKSGIKLSPLTKEAITQAANYYYSGTGEIENFTFIESDPPFELNKRHLPAWRIDFDEFSAPSLYISAQSGLVVTKRHQFWRLFDWMFRFHIMDYGDEADPGNALLLYFIIFGLLASLTGLILMYFKVIKTQQKRLAIMRGTTR